MMLQKSYWLSVGDQEPSFNEVIDFQEGKSTVLKTNHIHKYILCYLLSFRICSLYFMSLKYETRHQHILPSLSQKISSFLWEKMHRSMRYFLQFEINTIINNFTRCLKNYDWTFYLLLCKYHFRVQFVCVKNVLSS